MYFMIGARIAPIIKYAERAIVLYMMKFERVLNAARIVELQNKGLSVKQISLRVGVTTGVVRSTLYRNGFKSEQLLTEDKAIGGQALARGSTPRNTSLHYAVGTVHS